MAKLSIADKPRVITEQARQLDLTRYGKTVFGMFSGTPQQVKLRFRNSLAGVVIDRFGKKRHASCPGRREPLHIYH